MLSIMSRADLKNKTVGVKDNTTSLDVALETGSYIRKYKTAEDCYIGLENGEIDAVIDDMPRLRYFVKNKGKKNFVITGNGFRSQPYSFVYPLGSSLKKKIDIELLKMISTTGEYRILSKKWFGISE